MRRLAGNEPTIFSRVLYQLSYLAKSPAKRQLGNLSPYASSPPELCYLWVHWAGEGVIGAGCEQRHGSTLAVRYRLTSATGQAPSCPWILRQAPSVTRWDKRSFGWHEQDVRRSGDSEARAARFGELA
jgi:hypothetical protein